MIPGLAAAGGATMAQGKLSHSTCAPTSKINAKCHVLPRCHSNSWATQLQVTKTQQRTWVLIWEKGINALERIQRFRCSHLGVKYTTFRFLDDTENLRFKSGSRGCKALCLLLKFTPTIHTNLCLFQHCVWPQWWTDRPPQPWTRAACFGKCACSVASVVSDSLWSYGL